MNTRILFSLVLLSACGDSGTAPNSNPDMSQPPAAFPAAPTLGAQIDRMGRPGVNTALTNPFWDTTGDKTTGKAAHEAKQDAYNQAADPTKWAASFGADIKASVAVYDSLDQDTGAAGAGCGNQAGFGALGMPDYTVLGSVVLPDDELYVDTTSGTCNQYLAVELAALGVKNTDCGGRAPTYDTIDVTYAALAAAALAVPGPAPNLDGVASDGSSNKDTFPFLGDPL